MIRKLLWWLPFIFSLQKKVLFWERCSLFWATSFDGLEHPANPQPTRDISSFGVQFRYVFWFIVQFSEWLLREYGSLSLWYDFIRLLHFYWLTWQFIFKLNHLTPEPNDKDTVRWFIRVDFREINFTVRVNLMSALKLCWYWSEIMKGRYF